MPHDESISKLAVVPLLWVENMEQAIRFYEEIGFKITESWKSNNQIQWCRVEFYDAALMLQEIVDSDTQEKPTSENNGIQLYFITDDVDALYTQILANGLKVSVPKIEFYGMKQIFLTDPDGRTLCFESLVET